MSTLIDLVQVQRDSLADKFLEACLGDVDFVSADWHLDEDVFSVGAALHIVRGMCRFIDERYRGGRH